MSTLAINRIRIDGGTQSRAEINQEVVQEYAELNGVLPELIVYYDGSSYWLSSGFHRLFGAKLAGKSEVECDIRQGSLDDAMIESARSNIAHGMRRSNADKRASVLMLLRNPHFESKSNRWVAEICHVDDELVSVVRKSYDSQRKSGQGENSTAGTGSSNSSGNGQSSGGGSRTGKDGKQRPATTKKLCERCARVGETKDCPACKELRKSGGGRKRKKPEPIPDVLDKLGQIVPQHLRDVFADETLPRLLSDLENTVAMMEPENWFKRAAKLTTDHQFIVIDRFQKHATQALYEMQLAIEAVQAGLPHAVCPKCKGIDSKKDGKTCRGCRGGGYVPAQRYSELTNGSV